MATSGQVHPACDDGKESSAAPPPMYAPQYPPGAHPMQPMQPIMQQPMQYVQPGQATVVVQQGPSRPSSYMALSCFVYWCCNCLFGGIAFALSMASSSAADENDMEQARKLGKASMWVNVAGILLVVIGGIIGIIVYFALFANAVAQISYTDNDFN